MSPETRFERDITESDCEWLAHMTRAMQPQPMVSVDIYCAAVDANDYVTRQNFALRRRLRRVIAIARGLRKERSRWREACVAVAAAALALGWVLGRISG